MGGATVEIFGSNTPAAVQYLLAFVIILGLLAAFAALLRRITGVRSRVGFSGTSARHRQQRLGIVDAVDIDSQRQLLLLRRDNVEHLVMVGGPNDLLVESGIGRMPYRAAGPQPVQPHHAPVLTESSMAVADEAGPEAEPVRAPARMEMPQPNVVEPSAGLSGGRSPGVTRPLATPVAPSSPLAPTSRPVTSPTLPPVQPPVPPIQPVMPTAPSGSLPRRDVTGTETAGAAGVGAGLQAMPLSFPGNALPGSAASQATTSTTTREQDAPQRPLSGVTRQLEEALKRPFGAVRPSPVTGIKFDDVPAAKEAGEGASPVEAGPSSSGAQADIQPVKQEAFEPARRDFPSLGIDRPTTAPYTPPSPIAPVSPARSVSGAPSGAESFRPLPGMAPTRAVNPPAQEASSQGAIPEKSGESLKTEPQSEPSQVASTPAPKTETAKPPAFDLTSLENIEAEFARLLGRNSPKGE